MDLSLQIYNPRRKYQWLLALCRLFPYHDFSGENTVVVHVKGIKINPRRKVISLNLYPRIFRRKFIVSKGFAQHVMQYNLCLYQVIADFVINDGLVLNRIGINVMNGNFTTLVKRSLYPFFNRQANIVLNFFSRTSLGEYFKFKAVLNGQKPTLNAVIQVDGFIRFNALGKFHDVGFKAIAIEAKIPLLGFTQIAAGLAYDIELGFIRRVLDFERDFYQLTERSLIVILFVNQFKILCLTRQRDNQTSKEKPALHWHGFLQGKYSLKKRRNQT